MVSLNASGAGCPQTNAHGLIFSSDYCGELFLLKAQEGKCGDPTQNSPCTELLSQASGAQQSRHLPDSLAGVFTAKLKWHWIYTQLASLKIMI